MRFNTSHVVIYHSVEQASAYNGLEFQYISCCYLSSKRVEYAYSTQSFNTSHVVIYHEFVQAYTAHPLTFQYISCCYLSTPYSSRNAFIGVSIHLMLLFIIQSNSYIQSIAIVSIHLMLLFIPNDIKSESFITMFQYISCCYLSLMPLFFLYPY